MAGGMIRLRWHKAKRGYELTPLATYGETRGRTGSILDYVEERGNYLKARGPLEPYEADFLEPGIFIELANTPPTPENAIDFVNKWGLLTRAPVQDLTEFNAGRKSIVTAIEAGERGGAAELVELMTDGTLGKLQTRFEWKKRREPQFFLEAHTLIQFCHLEHLQS